MEFVRVDVLRYGKPAAGIARRRRMGPIPFMA